MDPAWDPQGKLAKNDPKIKASGKNKTAPKLNKIQNVGHGAEGKKAAPQGKSRDISPETTHELYKPSKNIPEKNKSYAK